MKMKRHVLLCKEETSEFYRIMDIYTGTGKRLTIEELIEFSKNNEIDNIKIINNDVEYIWRPYELRPGVFLIAKGEEQLLTATYDGYRVQEAYIIPYTNKDFFNEFVGACNLEEAKESVIDLTGINEDVIRFNNKAKLIGYPTLVFPIDKDNAMIGRYPTFKDGVVIPKCCTIIGPANTTDGRLMDFMRREIKSGFENVKFIGSWTFDMRSNQDISKFKNVIEIGDKSFTQNRNTKIIIPKNCKKIGVSSFSASKAEEIIIESNNIEIAKEAFAQCKSLKTLEIRGNAILGKWAFYECVNLEKIILIGNIEILDTKCFGACHSIKEIRLPHGLKEIKKDAFGSLDRLETVYVPKDISSNESVINLLKNAKRLLKGPKVIEIEE